jgi:hypothetical protein
MESHGRSRGRGWPCLSKKAGCSRTHEGAGARMPPELMVEGARVNDGRAGGIQQQRPLVLCMAVF